MNDNATIESGRMFTAALKDAVRTLAMLASLGDDVRSFRQQLASLSEQVRQVQATGNR